MASTTNMAAVIHRQHEEITRLRAENERLRVRNEWLCRTAAAVCWFDWSKNDDDAVAAIEHLRDALQSTRPPEPRGETDALETTAAD